MLYTYRARLDRVIDGDSVNFVASLGFYVSMDISCRLLGVNTPELRGGTDETKRAAEAAKTALVRMLDVAALRGRAISKDYPLLITTKKDSTDKYGRWLVIIYSNPDEEHAAEGTTINQLLIENGYAEPYPQ